MWGFVKKLEEEKSKKIRGLLKLCKKIQDIKKSLGKGASGVYRPAYRELLKRHKGYHRERKGMAIGL